MATMAGFIASCGGKSSKRWQQGEHFPNFELPDLDGKAAFPSAFSGVALSMNFWASWCDPCRREMAGLQKLSTLFNPGELLVVGVDVDSDVNLAREFILKNDLTFPMLSDRDMKVSNGILRIPGFPMTFLLTRERTIAKIVTGERDWMEPRTIEEIETLLNVRRMRTL
jgi:peroxiredoxin